jgi:hypothetical protein
MKSIIQSNYLFHRSCSILYKELDYDFGGVDKKYITLLDISKSDSRLADYLHRVGYTVIRLSEYSKNPTRFFAVVGLREMDMDSLQSSGLLNQFKNVMIYLLDIEDEDEFESHLNKISESNKFSILTKKTINQSQKHFLLGSIGKGTYKDWRPMVKYDCLILE